MCRRGECKYEKENGHCSIPNIMIKDKPIDADCVEIVADIKQSTLQYRLDILDKLVSFMCVNHDFLRGRINPYPFEREDYMELQKLYNSLK